MRKLIVGILTTLVVLSLLVSACAPKATPTPVPEKPTPVPEKPTPVPEEKFKVGLVTDVGKVDDGTFNQYAYEGMMRAVNELGLESAFIETMQPTDYEKNAQQFVDEGYNLIITVGFMFGETTLKMAKKYPDIYWFGVDQAWEEQLPNLAGPIFREDQAGFMAGALAGLMTKSKVVGIVAGMEIPPVKKFRNGYENGVKYVCPDCKVLGVYIDSFTDPARGKAAAESQIAEGADVIFGAGGPTGSGGILGAAQQGVWVIGVDQDEYYTTFKGGAEAGSDKLLSSAMKRVDLSTYLAVKRAYEGTFEPGAWIFEAANDGIGLAPFHETEDDVPDEVKAKLDEIFQMLADGTLSTGVDPDTGDMLAPPAPAVELGTEENPIIWSFVPSGEMERVAAGAEAVADLVYKETGLVIETNVATEYAGVVEAMCAEPPKAHMASLATFSYVLAADKGCAEAELVSVRYGSPTYNGQIITRADSGIKSIADLKGKTFCRPDPLSTSGWIIPMLTMRAEGIDPEKDLAEIVDAGSHDAVAAAVYNGDCDAGATYVDARSRIEKDYPDVMEKVIVIAVSADIPNDGVQYVPSFPRELRDKINAALLKIAETEEGKEALKTAYQWSGLIEVDDSFYDPFRQVLSASGMKIEDLIKE